MQYTLRAKTDSDNLGCLDLFHITAPTPKDALLKAFIHAIPGELSFRLYDEENNEMTSAFEVEGEVRDA
tara:strand:+ start:86 stop:292 length:207 start_codon:yes stop_codon:yes gene_type:complete